MYVYLHKTYKQMENEILNDEQLRYTLTKDSTYYLVHLYDGKFKSFVALKMQKDFENEEKAIDWFNNEVENHLRPKKLELVKEIIIVPTTNL